MPRRPRDDAAGSWHHVGNRGIAKKVVFEGRTGARQFLSRIARSVRRGEIEVHAFVLLPTHYHLLLRSPRAALSEGIRRSTNEFVRWFNRSHRRDGPLFRGRFWSRRVRSERYLRLLIRYIDQNPVRAGLVRRPAIYPYGSARSYLGGPTPRWLSRAVVEGLVAMPTATDEQIRGAYDDEFGTSLTPAQERFVVRRITGPAPGPDPLDDLLSAAPAEVLDWMIRKSVLADGTRPGTAVVDPQTLMDVVAEARRESGPWRLRARRRHVDGWGVVAAVLLRDYAACAYGEIGARLGVSESVARKWRLLFRTLAATDRELPSRAGTLLSAALWRLFPEADGRTPPGLVGGTVLSPGGRNRASPSLA